MPFLSVWISTKHAVSLHRPSEMAAQARTGMHLVFNRGAAAAWESGGDSERPVIKILFVPPRLLSNEKNPAMLLLTLVSLAGGPRIGRNPVRQMPLA